jgi:hypothetical protein
VIEDIVSVSGIMFLEDIGSVTWKILELFLEDIGTVILVF